MSFADDLLRRQNADGGWSYSRGSSWTEPTCYALLGLRAAGASAAPEIDRGAAWLARCQRADGGFAPRESVRESTWLAALALLLPDDLQKYFDAQKAARWLVAQWDGNPDGCSGCDFSLSEHPSSSPSLLTDGPGIRTPPLGSSPPRFPF